jgi:putative ABC transport system ATP-binding protein
VSGVVIEDLTVEYSSGGYTVRPFDKLKLTVEPGALALLLGPSGCGKTTLLSCLAGILTPTRGSIRVGGTEVVGLKGAALTAYRQRGVGVVFQAFNLVPSLDAVENVALPLRTAGVSWKAAKQRARVLLDEVGLSERLHHRPGDLSGGQQQRVAIARALAHDPPLLVADEPTAHLDYVQVEGILRILGGLADSGRTIVVSTHDERILPLADQVIEMQPRARRPATEPVTERFAAGTWIFRQGTYGEFIYTIEAGEVGIVRDRADGTQEDVVTLGPGVYFGEMGPLFGLPRSASARARTDVVLTGRDAQTFRDTIGARKLGPMIAKPGAPVASS